MNWKNRVLSFALTGCLAVGILAPAAMAVDTPSLPEFAESTLSAIGEKQMAGEALFTQTKAELYLNDSYIGKYEFDYVYDKDNKVRQQTQTLYGVTDSGNELLVDSLTSYFTYNSNGLMTKAENSNETLTLTYHADGNVATETYVNVADVQQNYTAVYTYGTNGMIATADLTFTGGVQAVATYSYDDQDRLIQMAVSAKGSSEIVTQTTYTYDDNGNLLQKNEDGSITSYTYDENNNCTSESFADEDGTAKIVYSYQLTNEWKAQNPIQIDKVFTDVSASAWYAPYIKSAYENCLVNGTSNTTFGPKIEMTRAMFVEILYNAAGRPAVQKGTTFSDVNAGSWYYDSVSWAEENSVTSGVGDGRFGPKESVTRQQMANLLYNYVEDPAKAVDQAAASQYPDWASVSDWAKNGMAWAVNTGAINGVKQGDVNYLSPKSVATRAEAATMLTQYFVK
ncbi:MAG: S-layer homology domain-containing protein [Eubacteriales bacterium]|nr:S-layer homology domain-containing protein [Eubacteriales bacterium]